MILQFWRTVRRFLKKLGIKLSYDSIIPLLDIYPDEIIIEKDIHIPMFIAALLSVAGTGKQPRCPSTDEWVKKPWYIYTTEYYLAIKRNVVESVLMRWMNLEAIIHNEERQKKKSKYRILTHIYGL